MTAMTTLLRLYSKFIRRLTDRLLIGKNGMAFFVAGLISISATADDTAAIKGRYVRLESPPRPAVGEDKRDIYRLGEIEVFSGAINVARQGKATSSPAGGAGGSKAEAVIDGDSKDFMASSLGVPAQVNPWVEIDLGQLHPIDKIQIYTYGSLNPVAGMWLVSVLDNERKVSWYRRCDLVGFGKLNQFVPKAFAGRYIGAQVPEGAKGWYSLVGEQEDERSIKVKPLELGPLPDFTARQTAFTQRDSAAAVKDLCRHFHAAVDPDAKGLEKFAEHYRRGEYRQALDAYRDFFFDRLAHPEQYGIPANLSKSVWQNGAGDMTVDVIAVKEAMNNRRVNLEGNSYWVGEVGAPGATRWIPRDPEPGKEVSAQEMTFFRMPDHTYAPRFMMFNDLVKSYVATGNREHLERWMDYLDDWCLYGREDLLNSKRNLTKAAEPSAMGMFCELIMRWPIFLQHRPEFARDIRSTTLARYLLASIEDGPPYGIRARRAELANWGAVGTQNLAALTVTLPEFRAVRYYAREAARLAMSSFIQNRTLDGETIEAGDEGHRHSDVAFSMKDTFNILPLMPLNSTLHIGDRLHRQYMEDLLFPFYRNLLTRISPGGYDWPCWLATHAYKPAMAFENRRLRINSTSMGLLGHGRDPGLLTQTMPSFTEFVKKEPEAAARISAIMDYPAQLWTELAANGTGIAAAREKAKASGIARACLPERNSDASPYSAMYFLRDKWEPGAEYFMMFSFQTRSQDHDLWVHPEENGILGYGAMRYDLMKEGRAILSSECIVIDKKPPNAMHDAIPTGGKTQYCGMAGRNVVDTRFHTSARFDLAEARSNAPYSRPERLRADWYGIFQRRPEIDNTPIMDVTAYRQVFHVRGEGVWIVSDRLENPSGKQHEYSTFWTYPAWVNSKGAAEAIRSLAASGHQLIVEDQGRVSTAIPDYANLSSHFFGPDFRMINRIGPKGEYVKISKPQIEIIKEALDKGVAEKDIIALNADAVKTLCLRQVGILWEGTGNQTLVTMHYTREPVAEPGRQFENDLREIQELKSPGGVTGFRAVTRTGTPVFFQSGPQKANALTAGPVQVLGESLLAVEKAGVLCGMSLGTNKTITLRGKAYQCGTADFEYELTSDGKFTATPICRAIDTVKISPRQNVFTDQASVSFAIPTQQTEDIEFRYTLDGGDPTLESAIYTGPFTIKEDTYVKVRPFRKGLIKTPFNIPGENAGKTVGAIFRKEQSRPALKVAVTEPGLAYEYFEAPWPTLFAHAALPGVLTPKSQGKVAALLDEKDVEKTRTTDKAYAIRYNGYIQVPGKGIYSFYAPVHLYTPTMDAGYDLRLWIDGEEWFPSPTLHSENIWHIALDAGLHRLDVSYVDYRWKEFKNEYWIDWQEREMWKGIPILELEGPGVPRRSIPNSWLFRDLRPFISSSLEAKQ